MLLEALATTARPVRRLTSGLLRRLERSLHPVRRRRALRAIRRLPPTSRVLFVCLGNICRSPYAEARFRHLVDEAERSRGGTYSRAKSGGFILPGREPPSTALQVAASRGIDLGRHRSQLIDAEMTSSSDLVLVMTSRQKRKLRRIQRGVTTIHLGDLDPQPVSQRDIPDPLDQSEEVFQEVYGRIDRAIQLVVEALESDEPVSPRWRNQ